MNNKVLVLGGTGMLGHKLTQVLSKQFETWATIRGSSEALAGGWTTAPGQTIGHIDVSDFAAVERAAKRVTPDVIINAIGIVKQLEAAHDPVASININSLLPHRLARLADTLGARLIHISTDCVFTGRTGMYLEDDDPDAIDLYGRSKLLGEVRESPHLTLRTSIIGRELAGASGLVEWFMNQPSPSVAGYRRAIFSGLPTLHLARLIGELIENHPEISGLYHASAEPINKMDLLELLARNYNKKVNIEPVDVPELDRSLDSTRLRRAIGWTPPAWPELVSQMAVDSQDYHRWRKIP